MRRNRSGAVGLFVAAWLVLPACVEAGPYINYGQPCDCPPTHYSGFHIATPIFYRWAAWCQGPTRYTFAQIRYPDIASTVNTNTYHCPSVNPLQYSLDHYLGLNGSIPCSIYQSSETDQSPANQPKLVPQPNPPQQLPPPKEIPEKK